MLRYFAIFWDPLASSQVIAARVLTERITSSNERWHQAFLGSGVSVYITGLNVPGDSLHPLPCDHGVVLGTLFRSKQSPFGRCPPGPLPAADAERIVETQGRALVERYWGQYVAFMRSQERGIALILRDPTGNLSCYHGTFQGAHALFSSVVDYIRFADFPPAVDEELLRARVSLGPNMLAGCGLTGIREVGRGQCWVLREDGLEQRLYWDPKSIASDTATEDLDDAARAVRATLIACAEAWSTCFSSILLRLSGGLDSSSVLGALGAAAAQPRITCITYYMPNPLSDERPWARLASTVVPCQHLEFERDVRIDLRELLYASPTPLPVDYFLHLEISRAERELANARGATATFTGDGGDNLFGSDCRDFLVTDYIRRRGIHPHLYRVAEQAAMLTNTTVWYQLRKGFGYSERAWAQRTRAPGRQLIAESLRSAFKTLNQAHPWFQDHSADSLALFSQLLPIAVNTSTHDPFCPPQLSTPRTIDVINSQPLVELCLRIPLFVHAARGQNRATLRRAMRGIVPDQILRRTWKDRSPRSLEDLIDHNLPFIRELLLEGHLCHAGLLDKKKLETHFSRHHLESAALSYEILDHAYVEAWYQVCSRRTTPAYNHQAL
jgi:asparagine synthase (glutamine-hydrolysing)